MRHEDRPPLPSPEAPDRPRPQDEETWSEAKRNQGAYRISSYCNVYFKCGTRTDHSFQAQKPPIEPDPKTKRPGARPSGIREPTASVPIAMASRRGYLCVHFGGVGYTLLDGSAAVEGTRLRWHFGAGGSLTGFALREVWRRVVSAR